MLEAEGVIRDTGRFVEDRAAKVIGGACAAGIRKVPGHNLRGRVRLQIYVGPEKPENGGRLRRVRLWRGDLFWNHDQIPPPKPSTFTGRWADNTFDELFGSREGTEAIVRVRFVRDT